MPVVNLDVVAPEAVTITKRDGSQSWRLAADVPAAVMVRVLYLGELEQENPAEGLAEYIREQNLSAHQGIEELERRTLARQEKIEAETLRIFGGIWRWSYPDATDEWLQETFSHRDRYAVVDAFFVMRSPRSAPAPNGSDASSTSTDSAAAGTATQARGRKKTNGATTRSGTH